MCVLVHFCCHLLENVYIGFKLKPILTCAGRQRKTDWTFLSTAFSRFIIEEDFNMTEINFTHYLARGKRQTSNRPVSTFRHSSNDFFLRKKKIKIVLQNWNYCQINFRNHVAYVWWQLNNWRHRQRFLAQLLLWWNEQKKTLTDSY